MMDRNKFEELIKLNFPWVNQNTFNQIEQFKNMVQSENKKYNLTRLDSDDKIYSDFLYESIIVYKDLLKNEPLELLDIGSGAGIPAIIIKIIFDKINVTIIESNAKKVNFHNEVIKKLDLKGIISINARVEEVVDKYHNYFDITTSRAVASLKVLLEVSYPLLKLNGLFIAPKSLNYENEINDSQWIMDQYNINNLTISHIEQLQKTHFVISSIKTQECPNGFPRMWKDIIK